MLGERLRALREAAGTGLDEANAALKWYRGKLSKVENGMLAVTEAELSTLLTRYGVSGPEAGQVAQLAVEARRRAAPERVNDWAKQYLPLERAASEIRMVYSEIPGLLQTKEAAKAQLVRSPVVMAVDLDSMAAAREERGNRLYREGAPQVWVVLGEEAMLRRIGTPQVMASQLRRLREMATLPTVLLRVVPLDHGPYAALSCPFTLLWIRKARATIAYVETLTGADYIKSTAAYMASFDQVYSEALPEADTLTMIDRRLTDLGE